MTNTGRQGGLWEWLRDESNRKVMAFLGSGLVAVVSGLWVAYQSGFFASGTSPEKVPEAAAQTAPATDPQAPANVVVGGDGVAVGGDFNQKGDIRFGD